MLNSDVVLDAARRLAGSLLEQAGHNRDEQIRLLVSRLLGRHATEADVERLSGFLDQQELLVRAENRDPGSLATAIGQHTAESPQRSAALVDLCLAMLNASEFLYID